VPECVRVPGGLAVAGGLQSVTNRARKNIERIFRSLQRACILDCAFVRSLPRRLRISMDIFHVRMLHIYRVCFPGAYIPAHSPCAVFIGLRLSFLLAASSVPPIPLWTRLKVSGTLEGTYHMIQGVVGKLMAFKLGCSAQGLRQTA